MNIVFSKPAYGFHVEEFINQISKAMSKNSTTDFAEKAKDMLRQKTQVNNLFLTTSCSTALNAIALTLSQKFSGSVIVPSFTFTSTAAAFESVGFNIVYADVTEDTLCLDVNSLEQLRTEDLIAVVTTNYGGYVRNHEQLREWCDQNGVFMIEDAAHSIDSAFKLKTASVADFATFSFHSTKNLSSVEGGALVVNNIDYLDQILFSLNKGTNRHNFLAGKIDKYEWVGRGSNFMMTEFHSAILLSSLLEYPNVIEKRKLVWNNYAQKMTQLLENTDWKINPLSLKGETLGYHIFFALAPTAKIKKEMIHSMNLLDIPVQSHYPPLHLSLYGSRFSNLTLPVTESISDRIIRFPLHGDINQSQQEYILRTFENLLGNPANR